MELTDLNRILEKVTLLSLNPLNSAMVSATALSDGRNLYLAASPSSLLIYLRLEKLGALAAEHPRLFPRLLGLNLESGNYDNLRLTYDETTTVLWLCRNIVYEDLDSSCLETVLGRLLRHSLTLGDLVRNLIMEELESQDDTATEAESAPTMSAPDPKAMATISRMAGEQNLSDQDLLASMMQQNLLMM